VQPPPLARNVRGARNKELFLPPRGGERSICGGRPILKRVDLKKRKRERDYNKGHSKAGKLRSGRGLQE